MVADTPLLELRAGRTRPFGPGAHRSAIEKDLLHGPVRLGPEGLAGDEQADRRHHGGPEKALHHYAAEHYAAWRARLPERAAHFVPGAFGENLSTRGLHEWNVHVGDVFRLGTALLQVSQGRQPCWKLNLRFDIEDMARRVQDRLETGWYYRVLQPGTLAAGDTLQLIERPEPDWPLGHVLHGLYREPLDRELLEGIARLQPLSESWRRLAQRRLDTGSVEDWTRRTHTPAAADS